MEGNASFRRAASTILLAIALIGCRQSPREPVTLRYTYSWNEDRPKTRALLQQFTQETGNRVESIPIPEYTRDYLDLAHKLLKDGSGADLLNIDLIWAPILEPDLIDLRPYLAAEIPQLEPQLLDSYTVNGKLVAVPFNVPLGALEYRADLLREYGYDHPPKTWSELESMAQRIQTGERAKGIKDFWGYVWQGADGEALTCNALEWQVAAGGGRIIEQDRTISVNNPAAIRAWEQARHWVGWISPPSVVAYRELDTELVFDAGKAAFNRIWFLTPMTKTGQARQIGWRSFRPPVVKSGFSRMPGGPGGLAGTLGGTGTAVSLHTSHRQEAIALLRFQLHALMEVNEAGNGSSGPMQTQFADPPSDPRASPVSSNQLANIVARPSVATGAKYKEVSRAYIDAVHSVLTGQKQAPEVAAGLEKQLIEITGFKAGPPKAEPKIAAQESTKTAAQQATKTADKMMR
ncbi:MAG TPA: extracellular solute-binding protein [Bryobacteraceae bacterium]|nr:extracellular solute-binding protein [Bryobacteraceae bacterium]